MFDNVLDQCWPRDRGSSTHFFQDFQTSGMCVSCPLGPTGCRLCWNITFFRLSFYFMSSLSGWFRPRVCQVCLSLQCPRSLFLWSLFHPLSVHKCPTLIFLMLCYLILRIQVIFSLSHSKSITGIKWKFLVSLLGQTGERVLLKQTQVKGCFLKHMEGHGMHDVWKDYKFDSTDGSWGTGSLGSTLSSLRDDARGLVLLTLHCWASSVVTS